MRYNFIHYFGLCGYETRFPLSDEKKLEIAKERAAHDLAKKLLENAEFKINSSGDVEGYIEIP